MEIKTKRLLIIMPFYFGYEKIIYNSLLQSGYEVYFVNENIDEMSFLHHCIYLFTNNLREQMVYNYYKKKLAKVPQDIEYILIIKGRTLTKKVIQYLKNKYKYAKYIMYQWDSVANADFAVKISEICDRCYTFDPVDADKYGWNYRPLFFDGSDCTKETIKYDMAFICSLHSERAKLLNKVEQIAESYGKTVFKHLYCDKWSFIRQKYFKHNPSFNINKSDIHFRAISLKETRDVYKKSKCIIDYKSPGQNGLTMRTIESIGHHCKLITNNINVINEDFYCPQNIYVYNLDNFYIPEEFFETEYVDVRQELYYKYSVEGWIQDLLY